jgi:hypothetical protein
MRILANLYVTIQKARIAIGGRINAIERNATQGDIVWLSAYSIRLSQLEGELRLDMARLLTDQSAWGWLQTVKGIGPTLACKLISGIDDIGRFDNISKLWSFSGYGLHPDPEQNGTQVIQRLRKGFTSTFNQRLKTTVYLAAESFLKCHGRFSTLYYNAQEHYKVTHPEWTPKHRQNASMRRMSKVFLACLWLSWREAEHLDVRDPWIIGKGEHTSYYKPADFSEKKIKVTAGGE